MSQMLNVSTSPHVRSSVSTASIMRDVAIALIPASLFGIYNFGLNALLIIAVCIASCVLTEYIYERLMKLPVTTGDWSAVVTGLLLALNLPSTVPVWIPIIGSVFAIIVVKQIFGGLGQNFMNPALGARCFLLISFTGRMTNFAYDKAVGFTRFMTSSDYDAITSSTPLAVMKAADKTVSVADALAAGGNGVTVQDLFIGTIGGTIGETSVIALLIGAVYLLAKKVISLRIPLTYIVTFAVFVVLFGGRGCDLTYLAAQICSGGLILGAFFMATDYVTSPITPKGQIVFGILLGILTGIFRIFGGSAEGVSYAIIFCNLLVPLIEKVTMPVPFGKEGRKDGKKESK